MKISRYCKIYPYQEDPQTSLVFLGKNTSVIALPAEMILDIQNGAISDEETEMLLDLGILILDEHDEKQEMLNYIKDLNAIDNIVNAIVILNLDCNLACRYCFEGTRKGRHYMSDETARLFIEYIKRISLAGKEEIKLVFYGGEPLMSVGLIMMISSELKSFADERGLKYSFTLVTNGTLLTEKIVKLLKPLGLTGAKVTLDGPKDVHNLFRPFKAGDRSSFDAIVNNIKSVCSLIGIQIGGNYTKGNYARFPALLDYLNESGLSPEKIVGVKFDPVTQEDNEYAPADFHDGCRSINEPWLVEAGIYLRQEILKWGYKTQKVRPSPCIIEIESTVVVNYDGSLYKCPGLVGRKEYCIGELSVGSGDYSKSHCLGNWQQDKCLDCSYLPLCFGGCRYMLLLRQGNMDGLDCRKEYFDAVLETFIKQDILYDDSSQQPCS